MQNDRSQTSTVKRNTAVNLAGAIVPVGVSLITVPAYLFLIGAERYGILVLVWVALDYFGLFGFGLDTATTNLLARNRNKLRVRAEIFWTALLINVLIGAIGAGVVYVAGIFLLDNFFNTMEFWLRTEVHASMPWIALAIPVLTVTSVLSGVLQAMERFVELAVLQTVGTLLFQIVPLCIAIWCGTDLVWLISAVVLSRLAASGLFMAVVCGVLHLRGRICAKAIWVKPLLQYGSWIALTGIISPILVGLDRLVIGAVLSAANVTYYAVPYNLTTKFSLVPFSLSKALFPRFSIYDREQAITTMHEGVMSLAVVLAPLLVIGIFACAPFLRLWIGADFADRANGVGEILLAGLWLSLLAYLPYTFLQAQGRPDLVAKFHLFELVPFVIILWLGVTTWGLKGAAAASSIRMIFDALLLFGATGQLRLLASGLLLPTVVLLMSMTAAIALPPNWPWYSALVAVLISVICLWAIRAAPPSVRSLVDKVLHLRSGRTARV